MTYAEKLRDPRWQRRRLDVMQNAGFACERCNTDAVTLNVHHIVYRRGADPWDYDDDDLACLCEDCHEREHRAIDMLRRLIRKGHPENIVRLVARHIDEESGAAFDPPLYRVVQRLVESVSKGDKALIKRELRSLAGLPLSDQVSERIHTLSRQLSEILLAEAES